MAFCRTAWQLLELKNDHFCLWYVHGFCVFNFFASHGKLRYHFFLHCRWFLRNLEKDFIPTLMHTTVYSTNLSSKWMAENFQIHNLSPLPQNRAHETAFLWPTKSRLAFQVPLSTIWAVGPPPFIAWAETIMEPSGDQPGLKTWN